jgi:hypothetical protein
VEVGGSESVAFCGGSTYKVFLSISRYAFPRGYQKSQLNAILSAHHSFCSTNSARVVRKKRESQTTHVGEVMKIHYEHGASVD